MLYLSAIRAAFRSRSSYHVWLPAIQQRCARRRGDFSESRVAGDPREEIRKEKKLASSYSQFFRDEQTRQVAGNLREPAMRAVHLLSAARTRPRAPDAVQVVHLARHAVGAKVTDSGAMRGATEHREYQQESPGADDGAAADAEQAQRPNGRHGARHRQDLAIDVLHGAIRSVEESGDAAGAALGQNIVRVVQSEAVRFTTGEPIHADARRVDVTGPGRLQERGHFLTLRGWTAEDAHRVQYRVLLQPNDTVLRIVEPQVFRSLRRLPSRVVPATIMNTTGSAAVRVSSASRLRLGPRYVTGHSVPMRRADSPRSW